MAILIKFSSKELKKKPSLGYLSRPSLSQASSFIVPWLVQRTLAGKTHTFSPWALSASLRPAHLPNGISTKAAEAPNLTWTTSYFWPAAGTLLASVLDAQNSPVSHFSKFWPGCSQLQIRELLGTRRSRPTGFSEVSWSPTFIGLALHLAMPWMACCFSPILDIDKGLGNR